MTCQQKDREAWFFSLINEHLLFLKFLICKNMTLRTMGDFLIERKRSLITKSLSIPKIIGDPAFILLQSMM